MPAGGKWHDKNFGAVTSVPAADLVETDEAYKVALEPLRAGTRRRMP